MSDVTDFTTTRADAALANAPLLALRGVGKTYLRNGVPNQVLQDITLALPAGSSLALIGKSGCGKSTLLRLMAGIDNRHAGTITRRPDLALAVVFQEHRLFPWLTALQNVVLGSPLRHDDKAAAETRARQVLSLVGLSQAQHRFPHELSGGMAQRVAIARALAGSPDILFLDEPFGALDAITRIRLQNELQSIARESGISLVVVTHDVEEAVFLADEVAVLHAGGHGAQMHLPIALPYPRDRKSARFVELRNLLTDNLLEGS